MLRPVIGLTVGYRTTSSGDEIYSKPAYSQAVVRAGGLPLLLPPTVPLDLVPELLARVDGLLLTGGPDIDPARYGRQKHEATDILHSLREAFDLHVLACARGAGLPVLAVCLGIQLVNVERGGALLQHLPSEQPGMVHNATAGGDALHTISVAPGTLLASIVGAGEFEVNSAHHQAIDTLGEGLTVSARAADGTIEAVEDAAPPFFLAVQWHPERIIDRPAHLALFAALARAAAETRRR